MKWIANKTFPHPVLSDEALPPERDYVGRTFQVTPSLEIVPDSQLSRLKMVFALSEESLRSLIAAGRAKYATEIHCRDTFVRRLLMTGDSEVSANFKKGELHRRVEISSYVVCTDNVGGHKSPNFHPEFGDLAFNFNHGDVLATAYPSVYYVEQDPEPALGTIFELSSTGRKRGVFLVDLENDNIQIVMHEEDAGKFKAQQNNSHRWPSLLASVYLSACCEALRAMSANEDHDDRIWCGVIRRELEKQGIQLTALNALDVAQKLLEQPVHVMLVDEERT